MTKIKVCVVSGTRADYGLLHWVIQGILADPTLELQLAVTGMHLSPEFGLTYRALEADGLRIDAKVEALLSSDTPVGVAKAVGLGTIGFADAFERLRPDWLVVLGDRFEILAATQAALLARIPTAHIGGGDITEGAVDEAIRHAITKMSHLHFATNEPAAVRIRQLGENPAHVFMSGNPGLDHLRKTPLLDRAGLEKVLDRKFGPKNLLVTFHPATLENDSPARQLNELLAALEALPAGTGLFFTGPNADQDGRALIDLLQAFVARRPNSSLHMSLGQLNYLSLMSQVSAVVGNSSSGLLEAPSFRIPTVDIGDRQRGRLAASSVIHCAPEKNAIQKALERAFAADCSQVVNPYGDGRSAERIVAALKSFPRPGELLRKPFFTPTLEKA